MVLSSPDGMSFPHSAPVGVCPSSQSSLRLDLDSYSTRLHYIALLDAGLHLILTLRQVRTSTHECVPVRTLPTVCTRCRERVLSVVPKTCLG